MNTILELLPILIEEGSMTFEITTQTQTGGRAWEEIEICTETELQEVAELIWEYASQGKLLEWTYL